MDSQYGTLSAVEPSGDVERLSLSADDLRDARHSVPVMTDKSTRILGAALLSVLVIAFVCCGFVLNDAQRDTQLVGGETLGTQLEGDAGHFQMLLNVQKWGYENPETGMLRVQCDDTVAQGSYGSSEKALVNRFHGNIGDRYSVECPKHCALANGPIYGCGEGPYMDASSICKAALGARLVSNHEISFVTIEIIAPQESYEGCTMFAKQILDDPSSKEIQIESESYIWWTWRKASDPAKILRYCPASWVAEKPGEACAESIEKYRESCRFTSGFKTCFGGLAFKLIEPAAQPVVTVDEATQNSAGSYDETVTLHVTPGDEDASTYIVCTTDGGPPDVSSKANLPRVDGPIILSAGCDGTCVGSWKVKCSAASATKGPSKTVMTKYVVLPRLPKPEIRPKREGSFVEEVTVSFDNIVEGATVLYTTDGSDPTLENAIVYSVPFMLDNIGSTTIKALSTKKPDWVDSHVQEAVIRVIERTKTPTIDPLLGTFIDSVTVHLECPTEGATIRYTTDGSMPSALSPQYQPEVGIELGLSPEGLEQVYLIKAIANRLPDMGDSYVAASQSIIVQPQVALPVVFPASSGPYTDMVYVTISCETAGATIHYTTDGSVPTIKSPIYDPSKEYAIDTTDTVVNARAFAPHYADSEVAESEMFILQASEPTFGPDGGTFIDSVGLTLSCATPDAAIHYTLDGSEPTEESMLFSGVVAIYSTDTIVRAIAVHSFPPELRNSNVSISNDFIIKASAPVIVPDEGSFTGEALIKVTSATPGAVIRCTLDGSEPNADSPVCSSPISVVETGTHIKAVATRDGLTVSDVASTKSPLVIKAVQPTLTPNGGTFTNQMFVVMSCEAEGCIMHYTTDGETPTAASTLYTEPVLLEASGIVVRAITVAPGKTISDISVSSEYRLEASAPTFIANGTEWENYDDDMEFYVSRVSISIETNSADAEIFYTTDGTIPSEHNGVRYTEPYVDSTLGHETLKAIALSPGLLASPISSSAIYDIVVRTSPPKIEPHTGGPFTAQVVVNIEAPQGASVYYTLDGSDPTLKSTLYDGPFAITKVGTTILKAIATKNEQAGSHVVSMSFLVLEQVQTPVIAPMAGVFTDTVTVHIDCGTEGAKLRYTIDGSVPNAASREYNAATGIVLGVSPEGFEQEYDIKAVGLSPPEMGDSLVAEAHFVVQPQAIAPTISPEYEGPFLEEVQVTASCGTPGAKIHYTTDGSMPTPSSPMLQDADSNITLYETDMMVKARAFAPHYAASEVTDSPVFILQAVEPTFEPDGGEYVENVLLTLSCATPDAAIHYTLDGSEPTETSEMYSGPFEISETEVVVKAIAVRSWTPTLRNSNVSISNDFIIKASAPVIVPDEGSFTGEALIKVTSATPGAVIRCTLDGSEPNADSPVCSSPISVVETGTHIKAVATRDGLTVSDVASTKSPLVIKAVQPTLTPNGGTFTNQVFVVMSCEAEGCIMHYTTDGETPTAASTLYTGPVLIDTADTVLRAISVAPGNVDSDVVLSIPYSIEAAAPTFSANGTAWADGVMNSEEEDYVEQAFISIESTTPDAVIVFTTDGGIPSEEDGIKYIEPYSDDSYGQDILKAIAYAPGKLPSPMSTSLIYDIIAKTPQPKINPDYEGPFVSKVVVSVSSPVLHTGGKVHMTLDGSDPTHDSPLYTESFSINTIGTTVLKVMATMGHQVDSDIVTQNFVVIGKVATPLVSPDFGIFAESVAVHLTCATDGATIRYTTHQDETPTAASAEYNPVDGITLGVGPDGSEATYVVKAIALKPPELGDSSVVESHVITVQPRTASPVISPDDSQTLKDEVTVTIECSTPGATIKYTTDGSDPAHLTHSLMIYEGPFNMTNLSPALNTVRALAEAPHMAKSEETAANYVLKPSACTPSFPRPAGIYIEGVIVAISCPVTHHGVPGNIYYTLDGSEPDASSEVYSGPIEMTEIGNQTIRAVALGPHVLASDVIESPYYAIIPDPICQEGEYEPHTGMGRRRVHFSIFKRNCEACPLGGISPRGSKGRLSCVAGEGYTGDDGGPFTACLMNTFKAEPGAGSCTACPRGTGTEQIGAVECLCLPGTYGPEHGPCDACPKGSYSENLGAHNCTPCGEGGTTYKPLPEVGSRSRKDCVALPGYTNGHDWHGGPFVECGIGQYKNMEGPSPCKLCPSCTTTTELATVSISQCVADADCEGPLDHFYVEDPYRRCQWGFFKAEVGNGFCHPCSEGGPGSLVPACGVIKEADVGDAAINPRRLKGLRKSTQQLRALSHGVGGSRIRRGERRGKGEIRVARRVRFGATVSKTSVDESAGALVNKRMSKEQTQAVLREQEKILAIEHKMQHLKQLLSKSKSNKGRVGSNTLKQPKAQQSETSGDSGDLWSWL